MDDTLILVEGTSDAAALRAAADIMGVNREQVRIEVMDGITNLRRIVTASEESGHGVAGMYDAEAQEQVERVLWEVGLIESATAANVVSAGFFRCEPDLEGELIDAVGPTRVVSVIGNEGDDLRRFRKLQHMPEWRDRPVDEQLRRWLGSGAGRKTRYAELLASGLTPDTMPTPLRSLLAHVRAGP